MAGDSSSLDLLAEDDASAQFFRQARGAERAELADLPWLDIDKAFFVGVNERPGDDVAIALDYRTDPTDPRALASDFLARVRAVFMARGRTDGSRGRV